MNIKLDLTIEETNFILKALAEKPYLEVAQLIENIKSQAEKQITNTEPN